MARVSIVIPCYNEASRLNVEQFTTFSLPGHELRVLFVNDGSHDATLDILQQIHHASKITDILNLESNSGKAEAVRRGVLQAFEKQPDYVGFWDADLSTPLEEIPVFCDALERRPKTDIVFGARVKLLGRCIDRKPWRHYVGRCFATAVSLALSLGVYDTQCGAKLFRANQVLREAFAKPFVTRWIFDVEIIARYMSHYAPQCIDVTERIEELPLMQWRDVAGSKLKMHDGIRAFGDLARIYHLYVRPLRKAGLWPLPFRG
jgi:dolichyl-phosphate beta-glucosyltransferase